MYILLEADQISLGWFSQMAMTVIQALVLTVDRARICMGILIVTVLQDLLAKGAKQVNILLFIENMLS